ncbi:hypothetical protein PJE062_1634 [Pseudovibrio sp. JE062]|nr:hypothetical protein PJE062_1634 [Pseudovibrio sp. JE062]
MSKSLLTQIPISDNPCSPLLEMINALKMSCNCDHGELYHMKNIIILEAKPQASSAST